MEWLALPNVPPCFRRHFGDASGSDDDGSSNEGRPCSAGQRDGCCSSNEQAAGSHRVVTVSRASPRYGKIRFKIRLLLEDHLRFREGSPKNSCAISRARRIRRLHSAGFLGFSKLQFARWRRALARSHPTSMLDTYETVLSRVVCPRRIDPFATELQLPERLPRGRWALPTPKDRPPTPEPPPHTVLKVSFHCHAPLP